MQILPHIDPKVLFRDWRNAFGLTQARMAELMGVPLRTYEDLEAGRSTIRPVHINAAAFALVEHAADNRGLNDLPVDIGAIVERAAGRR